MEERPGEAPGELSITNRDVYLGTNSKQRLTNKNRIMSVVIGAREYFSGIGKIPYEGKESDNPLAFKYLHYSI